MMENIQESLQKISPKEIAQTPLAYALYVVVAVLVSVIGLQQLNASSASDVCETEKKELKEQLKAERQIKDEFFKAYLVEKAVNTNIQHAVDSTAIEKHKKQQK